MKPCLLLLFVLFLFIPANAKPSNAKPSNDYSIVATFEDGMLNPNLKLNTSEWSRLQKLTYIRMQLSKLNPVKLQYDESSLSENDRKMVAELVEASKVMNQLFMQQTYSKNEAILKKLTFSSDSMDILIRRYFMFNFGPFDRLNNMSPFYGYENRPLGANFYPEDLTKAQLQEWIKQHPEDEKAFNNDFTVIRRDGKNLVAVPYHKEYAPLLKHAIEHLKNAAALCKYPSLKKYLLSRAEAFTTDNYYQSDVDWMCIEDSPIELIIGPYEVYEDHMMNAKASYESFVYQTLPKDAKEFSQYVAYLPQLEGNLPIPDKDKNMDRDFSSPIRIVNLIFSAGDAHAGIHTSAFALPNDERVRKEKGSKKVMLKNIMSAKFDSSTLPIGKIVVAQDQVKYISFDAYFKDVVFHELSHGLGPGILKMPDGTVKDVRTALGSNYSAIEECKADTLAIYNQFYLMDKGVISPNQFKPMCVSYLTGIFRSVRFGVGEAHGRGALVQLNWMMEKGAFSYDSKTGRYSVNFDKFRAANASLAKALLDVQRAGDFDASKLFLENYTVYPEYLSKTLQALYDVPVDIILED